MNKASAKRPRLPVRRRPERRIRRSRVRRSAGWRGTNHCFVAANGQVPGIPLVLQVRLSPDNYQYTRPKMVQSWTKQRGIRLVFDVPAAILRQTTKCGHDFSCLRTGRCGDSPMCDVAAAHAEYVLCVRTEGRPACQYHVDFGGAGFCVCPVRCTIHQQQVISVTHEPSRTSMR